MIRLLSRRQLSGTDFAEALVHIEICDECRELIPKPAIEEVIERLLSDDFRRLTKLMRLNTAG